MLDALFAANLHQVFSAIALKALEPTFKGSECTYCYFVLKMPQTMRG